MTENEGLGAAPAAPTGEAATVPAATPAAAAAVRRSATAEVAAPPDDVVGRAGAAAAAAEAASTTSVAPSSSSTTAMAPTTTLPGTRAASEMVACKAAAPNGVSGASREAHTAASTHLCSQGGEAELVLPTLASTTPSAISGGIPSQAALNRACARLTATTSSSSARLIPQTGDGARCEGPSVVVGTETAQTVVDRKLTASQQTRTEAQMSHLLASVYGVQVTEGSCGAYDASSAVSSLPPSSTSFPTAHSDQASRHSPYDAAPSGVSGVRPPAVGAPSAYHLRRSPLHTASVAGSPFLPSARNVVFDTRCSASRSSTRAAATSHRTPAAPSCTSPAESTRGSMHTAASSCGEAPSCVAAHVYSEQAPAGTPSPGSSARALAAFALGDALAVSACSVDQLSGTGPHEPVCQEAAAAVGDCPSPQQRSSGGAARLLPERNGFHRTVVSVSITVINHSLETPLHGLDPGFAPFSSKRITRVPIIRVYGVINEAFYQVVPNGSQHRCRKLYDNGGRAPRLNSISAVSLDQNRSATSNVSFTSGNRRVIRCTGQRSNSESSRSHHHSHQAGLFINNYSGISSSSNSLPAGHGISRNVRSGRKTDSTCSTDVTNFSVSESPRPGAAHVPRARTIAEMCSDNGLASRVSPPNGCFGSLLGPPAAYSAIARKLNREGALVQSLDVLKGRSCCAAIHGVLPYFYVPLPLDAHAHPRTWLRWFSCRLREAEEQSGSRKQYHAEGSLRHASSSDSQQRGLIGDPIAVAGISGEEKDSVRLHHQPQQTMTKTDHNNRVHEQSSLLRKQNDHQVLIYDVQLVWRRSLYGYDHVPRLFAQVFTLLPGFETRQLAGLILQGTVTGQPLQPFEVHIPFTQHFLADYKLRGMDTLIVCDPIFVAPFVLSPEQLCSDSDLLLSSMSEFIKEATPSAAAATLQRHVEPSVCCTECRKAADSVNSCACLVCTGACERAAVYATDILMQPPAGVLLFTSWRKLWGCLSRAAAEVAATDFVTHSRTSHRLSDSTDTARATAPGCRQLPSAPGGPSASQCSFASSRTATPSHRCCVRVHCCHKCLLSKFSSRISSGIGPDLEHWPTPAKGPAAGVHAEPPLLSSINKTRDVDNTSGSNARSSCNKLDCALTTNGRRNTAVAFATSTTTTRPQGVTGKQGTSTTKSDAQRRGSSSSCVQCCSRSRSWGAGVSRPTGEGQRSRAPLPKRTTSCETEFHVVAPQIMNHLFEARGSRDSHCHSMRQTPDDGPGLPLPSQPLLDAVRDYWHEEAVRAAALGVEFTPIEYPVKLTPPPTLPPAAVAALKQRQCCLAKQAVPQACKDQLRRLLTQVGVRRSETRAHGHTHESQVNRDHQLRAQRLHLHEEGVGTQALQEDAASEGPQVLDGGFVNEDSRLLEYQSGLSIAAADDLPLGQTTQHSSGRPPLRRKTRPSTCEQASVGAARLPENGKENFWRSSSAWSRLKAAAVDSLGDLPCTQDAMAVSAEDQEGKRGGRAGVYSRGGSASKECMNSENPFLFSLSQEPPSPSGTWLTHHRDDLQWLPREHTLSSPCAAPTTARNPGLPRLCTAGWASHTFHGGHAAAALDTAPSVNERSPAGAPSDEGTIFAAGATAGAAVVANERYASTAVLECAGHFSPTTAQQSTQHAEEPAAANVCRGSVTPGSSNSVPMGGTGRAPCTTTETCPARQCSSFVPGNEVCTHTVSADSDVAVAQWQNFFVGVSRGLSQNGVDRVRSLSPQGDQRTANAHFVTGELAAAAMESEEHVSSSARIFSDDFSLRQASAASDEGMHSTNGARRQGKESFGGDTPSKQAEGSEVLPAVEWQEVSRASCRSEDGSKGDESQYMKQANLRGRMRAMSFRPKMRWSSTKTQVTGKQKRPLRLQNQHQQSNFAQSRSSCDEYQSTSVDLYNKRQQEAQRTGGQCDAKLLEAQTIAQPEVDGHREQGRDSKLAGVEIASAVQSGTPAASAPAIASAAVLSVGSPLQAAPVALFAAPVPGAQARPVLERNVLASDVTGDVQVHARRSLSSAYNLRIFTERKYESADDCFGSQSSLSSHASTVVLSSEGNSDNGATHFPGKEGRLGAHQSEIDVNRRNVASLQGGKQDSQRFLPETVETNSRLTDLPEHPVDMPATEVQEQGDTPPVSSTCVPFQAGRSFGAFPVLRALRRQPERYMSESRQQVASSEPRLPEPRALSHEQPQKGQQEETQQEERQGQMPMRQEIRTDLVVDRWPDVPVLLPFYGDPLDYPLHSHRSAVAAAKLYSRSRRLCRAQRIRGVLQCERHEASGKQINRRSAAASTEQQSVQAGYKVILQDGGEWEMNKAQENLQVQHLSQATSAPAMVSNADVSTTLSESRNIGLAEVSKGASKHEHQQQPQLQDVQSRPEIGILQETSADISAAGRCYKAGSNVAGVFGGPGRDVKAYDGGEPPTLGQIRQTISSEDEPPVATFATQSSALKVCSACSLNIQPNREDTPFARTVNWEFCRSPPSTNNVLATCPVLLKQRLKKQARLSHLRQRRTSERRCVIACAERARSTRHPQIVLSGVYTAKRGVCRRATFACSRYRDKLKGVPIRVQLTRRKILSRQTSLIISSESPVCNSLHRLRFSEKSAYQNGALALGLPAAKRVGQPAKYLPTSVANQTLQNTKESIFSQRKHEAVSLTAEYLTATEFYGAPSGAGGGDEETGGSPSSGQGNGYQRNGLASCETDFLSVDEGITAPNGEQPPSQCIPELCHEYPALDTLAHSAGTHGHSGVQVGSWRILAGTVPILDRRAPRELPRFERETLTQQTSVGFGVRDSSGTKEGFDAVVPVGTSTPRTCARNGSAYGDAAHRFDVASACEMARSRAVSAGNAASVPQQRPTLATARTLQETPCGTGSICTSEYISPTGCVETPPIHTSCIVQQLPCEETGDNSVSTCPDGCMSRFVESGHRRAHSCTATSLGSVEIPVRSTGAQESVNSCMATCTAGTSEDDTAGAGDYSQLSAGAENTWALQETTKMIAVSAKAEADAAAVASAIVNCQRRRLLYGSLMVVEVLAERTGCSDAVPEGLGGPTPWKDAVLAVAFAIRDERLRTACDELRKRITIGSEIQRKREKQKGDITGSHIRDLLTYHEALAVIFIDQPYARRMIPQTATSLSAAKVAGNVRFERSRGGEGQGSFQRAKDFAQTGRPADISTESGDIRGAPFPHSFADFMASWKERHPPLDAHAQLKNYIPSQTQLFAVKNEYDLLRKTALFFTLVDPSIVLQWNGNVAGLGYLLRRAAVIGCDKELNRALFRRVDTALLWPLPSKSAQSPAGAGKISSKKGYETPGGRICTGADFTANQRAHERMGRSRSERADHFLQDEPTAPARIVLDCSRVLQQEVKLQLSTLEGVVQEVLGVTLPTIPIGVLLNLWKQGQLAQRRVERQEESVMVAAWKLWERRRIRCRWPASRQLPAKMEGSEHPQHHVRRERETMCQHEGHARHWERIHHLLDENSYRDASSNTHDSWPHSERESGDLAWGVATMGAVLKYLLGRLQAILALIDHVDVLPRTAELARLYGCDFHSALTRGSQFKVESVMLRATKRLGYVFASPSQKQVTEQAAPLCVPLVLEPSSGFYWSPVLVLDFQALYPSVMIANNICFSTSLGSVKVDPTVSPVKAFGVVNLHVPARLFQQIGQLCHHYREQQTLGRHPMHQEGAAELRTQEAAMPYNHFATHFSQRSAWSNRERLAPEDACEVQQVIDAPDSGINVLPNGSMFVSPNVRQGVFPQILWDLLRTRVMIKKMMNLYRDCGNQRLVQLLNHRQHGLKMIANVSYGYTAASFTGHMPCAEIADAIVQAARTTLMRAIELVENTPRWGGRVLYGDTDSLFVLVEKKSLEAAFEIGREIAYAVTQQNPPPIELQLQKVFLPCCLVSKKRYVGHAYTSPHSKPYFDAKGIESVRRDQCGCTSSVLESTLRTFFTTRDLSCVKRHLYRQWTKILRSDIPLKEFIFFRKCRLGSYKAERGAGVSASLPPQAKVAYERLYALANACNLGDADASPAARSPTQVPSLVHLPVRDLPRGERVPYVYADTKTGNLEGFPARQRGCRLLDFAVSPDKVKGGGRSSTWVQLFCRGTPQFILRNTLSRLVDKFTTGDAGQLEKAYRCCIDAEVDEHVPRPNDVEEAFMMRGWVEGSPWQNEQQGKPMVCDTGNKVKVSGRHSPSSARETCTLSCKGFYRSENESTQALSSLYLRYYIVKQIIPALERLFCLLPSPTTVNLSQWYVRMPKVRRTSPNLHRSPHRDLPRWNGTRRFRRVRMLRAKPVTSVSKRDVRRPDKCRQVLDDHVSRCSRSMAPCCLPHRPHATKQMLNGTEGPRLPHDVRCCCISAECHGNSTRGHQAPVHDSDGLGCRCANEKNEFHQRVSNSVCGEGNTKRQAAVGLTNELKQAEKQFIEMEALCEACAGSKICGAACSHAWHCGIYFRKLRTEEKIHDILSRTHLNLDGSKNQLKRSLG